MYVYIYIYIYIYIYMYKHENSNLYIHMRRNALGDSDVNTPMAVIAQEERNVIRMYICINVYTYICIYTYIYIYINTCGETRRGTATSTCQWPY